MHTRSAAAARLHKGSPCTLAMAAAKLQLTGLVALVPLVGPDSANTSMYMTATLTSKYPSN